LVPRSDPGLDAVVERLLELAGPQPGALFADAIRQSIDEVLDGPRTGRWDFDQLEKTEKTYVGTKVEVVIRAALALERGPRLDLQIAGKDVDIKWAMNSGWQIPQEAHDELCLCIGGLNHMRDFQVGVVRCSEPNLNPGENRDRKRTLSATGRAAMRMLVRPMRIPSNFVSELDPELRARVMAEPTIQARVTALFEAVPYAPVPRNALATIAKTTGDPMRRSRADTGKGDPLKGMTVLSSHFGNSVAAALGLPPLPKDHFMSVPLSDIEGLSDAAKGSLTPAARKRLGFD
jgi:hypothetical protein